MTRITALALLLAATPTAASPPPGTIVVDVGHSTAAPGATAASGATEFSYNRALALVVADDLHREGWRVLVPNTDGSVRSLAARPAAAAASGASLLLSIHHDSVQTADMPLRDRFAGFSVWASGSHPAAAASARCADAIGASMARSGLTPNLSHARDVPGERRDLVDAATGRYRRDDLAVLRLSRTPAVLVEAGVIVNPAEEAALATPAMRARIADAIVRGVSACLR